VYVVAPNAYTADEMMGRTVRSGKPQAPIYSLVFKNPLFDYAWDWANVSLRPACDCMPIDYTRCPICEDLPVYCVGLMMASFVAYIYGGLGNGLTKIVCGQAPVRFNPFKTAVVYPYVFGCWVVWRQ